MNNGLDAMVSVGGGFRCPKMAVAGNGDCSVTGSIWRRLRDLEV